MNETISYDEYISFFRKALNNDKIRPYHHQMKMFECFFRDVPLIFLKAPTGSGKTESVIIPYLFSIYKRNYVGNPLIYVLPTKTLINAQTKRIEKIIRNTEIKDVGVYVEMGLEPKTYYFKNGIVLTTLESFLMTLFGGKILKGGKRDNIVYQYYHLTASPIAGAIIVFDEVQMYQGRNSNTDENATIFATLNILKQITEFKKDYGGKIIIMTATMPELWENQLKEKSYENIEWDESDKLKRGVIRYKFEKEIYEENTEQKLYDKYKEQIKEEINKGNNVLWVVNTVSSAQMLYELASKEIPSILLHSRFTKGDRKRKEEKIISAKGKLIIATQVVESGLNLEKISLIFTEFCPLDSLLQRLGRGARKEGEGCLALIYLNENNLKAVYLKDDETMKIILEFWKSLEKEKTFILKNSTEISRCFEDISYSLEKLQKLNYFTSDFFLKSNININDTKYLPINVLYYVKEMIAPFQPAPEKIPELFNFEYAILEEHFKTLERKEFENYHSAFNEIKDYLFVFSGDSIKNDKKKLSKGYLVYNDKGKVFLVKESEKKEYVSKYFEFNIIPSNYWKYSLELGLKKIKKR